MTDTGHRPGRERTWSISRLCEEFDVTPRTLGFYEQKRLLSPARRGWTRVFNYRDRARLKLILRERLASLNRQRRELDQAIAGLERTCDIVDGMLKEREASGPAGAASAF